MLASGILYSSEAAAYKQIQAKMAIDEMTSTQTSAFISGLVEGMAYARYIKDGKNADVGMKCILEWYYDGDKTVQKVILAFDRFREYTANAIVGALIKKECGS